MTIKSKIYKLYNETSLNLFVITGVHYNPVDMCGEWSFGADNLVRYNRVFNFIEFVIAEFDSTGFPRYSWGYLPRIANPIC